MLEWWKQQLKHFRFFPVEVCDGSAVYVARQGQSNRLAKKWEKRWTFGERDDRGNVRSASVAARYMPDMSGYPALLGTTDLYRTAKVAHTPGHGPAGTLLIDYRVTDPLSSAAGTTGPCAGADCRFWVDPSHGYLTRRYEVGDPPRAKDGPNADLPEVFLMEKLTETPNGIWYPRVVWRLCRGKPKQDGTPEHILGLHFYLDFKAKMPDSLFNPAGGNRAANNR